MTSINNIKRVKYENNKSDSYINLNEYIIFANDDKTEKYIVFKFKNNVDQYLYGFTFELYQYNEQDKLIEKTQLTYKNVKINNLDTFVPDKKYKLHNECDHIMIEIVIANFERMTFAHGETTAVKFDFDDYRKTIENEEETVVPKKENKKDTKEIKTPVEDTVTTKIKDVTNQNQTIRPKTFAIITTIILAVFMVLTVIYHTRIKNAATYGDFKFALYENNTAKLTKYNGTDTEVTIPSSITINENTYYVTEIANQAFANSSVIVVKIDRTLPSEMSNKLTINLGAFIDSKSLDTIYSSGTGEIVIKGNAFSGCTKLKSINLPYATISKNAFDKITFNYMIFYDSDATYICELFGYDTNAELKGKLESGFTLNCIKKERSSEFYNGLYD